MSLDISKLEKVRKLEGGIAQARCPACAEGDHDRTGNHLRLYPDGKFGCCIHPKDANHRKRIFAIAGDRKPGTFDVRIKHSAGTAARQSVKVALAGFAVRTLRTPVSESVSGGQESPPLPVVTEALASDEVALAQPDFRTLRTPIYNPYAYGREDAPNIHILVYTCKGSPSAVLSVLGGLEGEAPIAAGERLPFLTADGTLSIPFDSPERYHWWKPDGVRLTVAETLQEVKERMKHAVTV